MSVLSRIDQWKKQLVEQKAEIASLKQEIDGLRDTNKILAQQGDKDFHEAVGLRKETERLKEEIVKKDEVYKYALDERVELGAQVGKLEEEMGRYRNLLEEAAKSICSEYCSGDKHYGTCIIEGYEMKEDHLESEPLIKSSRGGIYYCDRCMERFSDWHEFSSHMEDHKREG